VRRGRGRRDIGEHRGAGGHHGHVLVAAFHAIVPGVVRALQPEVLVIQHGTDSHREDPRADLERTVDGQRASYLALRKVGRLGLPMILDGDERCHPAG